MDNIIATTTLYKNYQLAIPKAIRNKFQDLSVENTIVNKAIINNGLKIVQRTPKTDSLYLDEKFFFTISSNKNKSFFLIKFIKSTFQTI